MAYIVKRAVSVRSGPGRQFRWLRNLDRGVRVEVAESQGGWRKLRAGGWVQGDYLQPEGVVAIPNTEVIYGSAPDVDAGSDRDLPPLGPPPFLMFRPQPGGRVGPPLGARSMWGEAHPRYPQDRAGHFTADGMERHRLSMERRRAARALGRLHATLMFLAQRYNPDDFPRLETAPGARGVFGGDAPDPISGRDREFIEQFDQARAAGYITQRGTGRWRSAVPATPEYLELERDPDFRADFTEAVRDHWTYVSRDQLIEEILLLIIQELLQRGVGRAARAAGRPGASAAARAAGRSVTTIGAAYGRVLAHVRALLAALRVRARTLADHVRRIVGSGERPVTVRMLPTARSGATLPGIGPGPRPPGAASASPLPANPPSGLRTEPLTEAQANTLHEYLEGGGRPVDFRLNQTWGDSMVESYQAKWIQHAGRARLEELPPHGFRVLNPDGTVREICVHLRQHPYRRFGAPSTD